MGLVRQCRSKFSELQQQQSTHNLAGQRREAYLTTLRYPAPGLPNRSIHGFSNSELYQEAKRSEDHLGVLRVLHTRRDLDDPVSPRRTC